MLRSVCCSALGRRGQWAVLLLAFVLGGLVSIPSSASAQAHPEKIIGPNACAECHKEEALVWKKTHHFTTFRDMPRSKDATAIAKRMGIRRLKADSLCLNCHFTNQAAKGKEKAISGISCESCHSAGKDWEKIHAEFSGHKTKEEESKAEAAARWKKSAELGMIRPGALYDLAKNCYSCHVVPQEKLVNVGKHPAGSAFELVSWSQGEVRHNLWYSKGKENVSANAARKRMLYLVGMCVELETAFRAVGVATTKADYAIKMAKRAAAARKSIDAIAKALPNVPEIVEIAKVSHSAGLKLNNNDALSASADAIAEQVGNIVVKYDGSDFSAIDGLIPGPDKYKGKPAK